jgi:hypothetical protein
MWNQVNWQVFSAGSPPPRSPREAFSQEDGYVILSGAWMIYGSLTF